jgi:sulfite reductase (NADPH) flavoprotein alpha-component
MLPCNNRLDVYTAVSTLPQALSNQSGALLPEQLRTLEELLAGASEAALWWVSGYAAGQAAARAPATPPRISAASTRCLTVLYGSQTGNSKAAATSLAQQAEAEGVQVRLLNIAEYSLAELARERFLAITISTQGDGDPPDDARLFLKQLASARAPKLPELHYSVLALGDSSYPQFCSIGRALDARLSELGARTLAPRVDADLDIDSFATPWRKRTLDAATVLIGKAPANITLLRPANVPAAAIAVSPARYQALVYAQQKLTARDSELDVRHVELGFDGAAPSYQPGDALNVHVETPGALIDEFLARSGLAGDELVEHSAERHSLRDWLRQRRELTRLTTPLLKTLFESHPEHPLRSHGTALLDTHQVLDLLAAGRVDWDAARWVAALAPLKPRAYSIASSPLVVGEEVHLTVALRRNEVAGIARRGLASGHLVDVSEGATLNVSLEPNARFRLPADNRRDVVMIGPGTGVAPFRAFLQQRVAEGAGGRHWLFFGHRHLRREFLYQTEWLSALKRGQLQRLDVAFSRDQAQPRYVQHVLAERAAELLSWLDGGAYVYVCGDARRMARDVEQALIEAIARVRGIDAEAASEELDGLASAGRYQRDVY